MYFTKRKDKHAQFLFSLSTVHMYNFHIFTVIYSSFYRFIWNQHNDQLPVGLLAQLVEHCTGITMVMGSNPIQAWIFFRPYFHYCSSSVHYRKDCFHIQKILTLCLQVFMNRLHTHWNRIRDACCFQTCDSLDKARKIFAECWQGRCQVL